MAAPTCRKIHPQGRRRLALPGCEGLLLDAARGRLPAPGPAWRHGPGDRQAGGTERHHDLLPFRGEGRPRLRAGPAGPSAGCSATWKPSPARAGQSRCPGRTGMTWRPSLVATWARDTFSDVCCGDPSVQRYPAVVEALDGLRRHVEDGLPGRAGLDLQDLCRWVPSRDAVSRIPFPIDPTPCAAEPLVQMSEAWHERFWWTLSGNDLDQLSQQTS